MSMQSEAAAKVRKKALAKKLTQMGYTLAAKEAAKAGAAAIGGQALAQTVGNNLSLAGQAYGLGKNFYDDAGKAMLHGNATGANYADAALDANLVTAWINPLGKALGLGTVGQAVLGGKKTAVEGDRLKYLQEKGVEIAGLGKDPETGEYIEPKDETRSREQQYKDMVAAGETPAGGSRWLETGDIKQSAPEDWWGYSTWYAADPTWISGHSENYRRNLVQEALDAGAIEEGKGTIDVDFEKLMQHMQEQYQGQQPDWWEEQDASKLPESLRPQPAEGEQLAPGREGAGFSPTIPQTPNVDVGPGDRGPGSWNPLTSPKDMPGYSDLTDEEKENLWGQHRAARGA